MQRQEKHIICFVNAASRSTMMQSSENDHYILLHQELIHVCLKNEQEDRVLDLYMDTYTFAYTTF